MEEFKIEIEIDENGNIKAETKGIEGEVCIDELENILADIEGEQKYQNKPEFYLKKLKNIKKIQIKSKI